MTHTLTKLQVLRLVIKEVRYFYDIETNREMMKRLGYEKPTTYLSDVLSGKSAVSDNICDRFKEKFLVNKEVFEGLSCEVFLPESPYQATLQDPSKSSAHIHIGHNIAVEKGAISADQIDSVQVQDDAKGQDNDAQDRELFKAALEEIKAQRKLQEFTLGLLDSALKKLNKD